MVHDPNNSCHEGDVVSIRSGWRTAKHVRHVVTSIIAPMGPPLSARPPVPTEVERLAAREMKRAAKDLRQAEKGRRVSAERVRERMKLERRAAHEALVERAKREKEERIAKELVGGKEKDEEMVRLEEELGELKKERVAARMTRLAEARVLCRKMYEGMNGRQRVRMRKLDWVGAVLNDESTFAVIMDMIQTGKTKEAIVALGVRPSQYNEAESVANQILSQASNYLAGQSAFWKGAARAIAAREKVAGMNDDAEEKTAVYSLSLNDLEQPGLPESQAAAQKVLDAISLLPGIESIDPQASFQQQASQAQEMLPRFVKQARELRMQVDSTSSDSTILEAAATHYEDVALQLQTKIARMERFKGFLEKYPGARAVRMKFNAIVEQMKLSKDEAAAARKEFATFYEERNGTKMTAETGQSGGDAANVSKGEVVAMQDFIAQQMVDAEATILHEGVTTQEAEKGKLEMDEKELPKSNDLLEAKHSTGPINKQAQKDKGKAMQLEEEALENEGEGKELNNRKANKENATKDGGEKKNGVGIFGWFRS